MKHRTIAIGLIFLSLHSFAQTPAWKTASQQNIGDLNITISQPVLVARSKERLWFPTITHLGEKKVLAIMSGSPDVVGAKPGKQVSWSTDGGYTWSPRANTPEIHGGGMLPLGGQQFMVLPFTLYTKSDGAISATPAIVSAKTNDITLAREELSVTGWPSPITGDGGQPGIAPFAFNRQTIEKTSGGFLGTIYGKFNKTQKRTTLLMVQSEDAKAWKIRATIASDDCNVPGREGPNEAAIARLKDGKLLCIFRTDMGVKYGQSFSSDEGKTWSEPTTMAEAFSVQPYLAVMPTGAIVLAGGRPGIYLFINADGTGKNWQPIDLAAIHNQSHPDDAIDKDKTTAYLHLTPIDDQNLLCTYDRVPAGWGTIPATSPQTNSVWVVKITVQGK